MTPALELRDLHFAYGRGASVRGVSLTLHAGDCYGFLGHNGAGKTTVMRLALGLLRPTRGSVRVLGIDAIAQPRAAKAQCGALIERPGFHLHATARQNLVALARLQGMTRPLAGAEADRVLARTGLVAATHRKVGTFSMGMRQRLGIAQALLGRPRVLLLDEPTNGLDPEGVADLKALLRSLASDDGVAVLVSSHQLAELDGLCNRVGVLREGAMVVEGDLAALRAQLTTRHVVVGSPRAAIRERLAALGVTADERPDGAFVAQLGAVPPGDAARALAKVADLQTFAPEPVALETIYLRASELRGDGAVAGATPKAPRVVTPVDPPPFPRWRAFRHELATLRLQRSTALLLALPALYAAWRVSGYRDSVQAALARVQKGELFSADAGSGWLALAQALQAGAPALALVLAWFASQSIAVDLAGDTLRNTLLRATTRLDVLLGKALALGALALGGGLLLIGAALAAAGALVGFGDLEEVTRTGGRQTLAVAADAAPAVLDAARTLLLPFVAVAAVALAMSALARRPARALALALCALLLPELFRDRLRDDAGWLLTSHLPTGLRDDSALGYASAVARGAADALWRFEAQATLAPLAWLAGGLVMAGLLLRRQRVA
ncbi:MAG: ABC transporter ATP-binding protein [Planctomycetes bacterium]|nr:ABC transporter ATP-binding protein [Planctomycetota bacterium]